MRRRYLVCYDIRDGGRLRQTHRTVKSFGDPLQYSVFLCDLSRAERSRLVDRLRQIVDQTVDTVLVFDLGEVRANQTAHLVISLGPKPALPQGGATIV